MSELGPELPPHLLAKRKRQNEEDVRNASTNGSGAKRNEKQEAEEKRRRIVGPVMPSTALHERPDGLVDTVDKSDSDSDDDGIGPALPQHGNERIEEVTTTNEDEATDSSLASRKEALKRDDWMMMPPKEDDLAARMDPSKLRARGFNTGKGAKGPPGPGDSGESWHETPEEKQKRLQNEMMGINPGPIAGTKVGDSSGNRGRKEEAKTPKHQAGKDRGPSLMDRHKKSRPQDEDDDPSKRAFDREKDMGSGMRISGAQKKEMLSKASNFSSRFAGGSYL